MPAPEDGGVDLAGTSACTRKLSRQPPGNVQRGRGANNDSAYEKFHLDSVGRRGRHARCRPGVTTRRPSAWNCGN